MQGAGLLNVCHFTIDKDYLHILVDEDLGGFDTSSSCLGTAALTVLLAQKLWNGWLSDSYETGFPVFFENSWPYLLAMLAVFSCETWILSSRLRARTHLTGWWGVPIMLAIIGYAACPPNLRMARLSLVVAFILLQFPLFIDKNVANDEETG